MRLLRVILTAALACAHPRAQQPPAATPELHGRVVAAATGDGLARVRIGVTDGGDVDAILTDDDGRFVVSLRRASALTLTMTKAGYAARRVALAREQVASGGAGEHPLQRGAALTGRLSDRSGGAIVGVAVTARRLGPTDLRDAPSQWMTESDDRGDYRIGGLPAGRYHVTAGGSGTSSPLLVEVERAEEVSSVNLALADAPPLALAAPPLAPRGGRSSIQGQVVGHEGQPLEGAVVQLRRAGAVPYQATAGADGRFSITGLPAGTFTLRGTKAGYVATEYGQRRAAEIGRTLRVSDGENVSGVTLVLPRGSAIVGTVVDENGDAVEGADVRALQVRYGAGRRMALTVPGGRGRRTDDRGEFRLFGLLPGEYLVSASVDAAVSAPGRPLRRGYAPSFYPGTAETREAWRVQLARERDFFGAHIVLSPSPATRVSGVALASDGTPLRGMVLLAASQRSRATALEPRIGRVGGDGSFALTNVPPGEYVVQALGDPYGEKAPEFASQLLTIADDEPPPLALTTSQGATLEARVVVEGRGAREPSNFSLIPFPADVDYAPLIGWGKRLEMTPWRTLEGRGLFGPTRFVLEGAPDGWYVKAIRIGGRDVTDDPVPFPPKPFYYADAVFVIATTGARISGTVEDQGSEKVADYTVVAFPVDRSKRFPHSRFLKFARPSQDHSFEITGLPPAEYLVAAVESMDATPGAGDWQDPAVLDALAPHAARVTVTDASAHELTVRRAP